MTPGDVFWVDYHDTSGRGQAGRRPAIVLQDDDRFATPSPMVLTVPLTSRLAALRFASTVRIDPTIENGLSAPSVALIFQLRAVDRVWLSTRLGKISDDDLQTIFEVIDNLMGR